MLKRTAFVVAAVLAAVLLALGVAGPASADYVYCDPVTTKCYTVIDKPAVDPVSNPDPKTGFTPGASQCLYEKGAQNVEIPCTEGAGTYWSNNRQCYVSLAEASKQNPPPAGGLPTGAWYNCNPYWGTLACDPALGPCNPPFGFTFWSNTPPPGITTLTPGQAAAMLIATFQLAGINIGFAPDPNQPGSNGYIGVPIWMWVNNPTPLTYGPYSQTATLGGITITATATVTSIAWNMGDGHTVACANAGTPYQVGFGVVDSPNCGYRYTQMSNNKPGGKYPITATSQWTVNWVGGGQTGAIPLTSTSTTAVEIRELQSVNVGSGN